MEVTERKKKKPPTFQYLPKSRARRLKQSWIENHKIRGKWKAQKRREGLTNQTMMRVEDTPDHPQVESNELDVSSNHSDKPSAPSIDRQSLRDLRRTTYAPRSLSTPKAGPSHPNIRAHYDRGGKREAGQPNMKLRMNVLLERIKRDLL